MTLNIECYSLLFIVISVINTFLASECGIYNARHIKQRRAVLAVQPFVRDCTPPLSCTHLCLEECRCHARQKMLTMDSTKAYSHCQHFLLAEAGALLYAQMPHYHDKTTSYP